MVHSHSRGIGILRCWSKFDGNSKNSDYIREHHRFCTYGALFGCNAVLVEFCSSIPSGLRYLHKAKKKNFISKAIHNSLCPQMSVCMHYSFSPTFTNFSLGVVTCYYSDITPRLVISSTQSLTLLLPIPRNPKSSRLENSMVMYHPDFRWDFKFSLLLSNVSHHGLVLSSLDTIVRFGLEPPSFRSSCNFVMARRWVSRYRSTPIELPSSNYKTLFCCQRE